MCGIAGVVERNDRGTSDGVLQKMVRAQVHRGPDGRGIHHITFNGWSIRLGHTRLAVLDLSPAAGQPMKEENGNCIVYNGEIYNYLDLRAGLTPGSLGWISRSDTEVILKAYGRKGVECLRGLRGMFALALWDESRKILVLARDPLGIKPLYYYQDGERFLFASELRALLASGQVPRRLSREGLLSYLAFGSVGTPYTVVEGVRSLRPGHCLTVEPGEEGLRIREVPYSSGVLSSGEGPSAVSRCAAVGRLSELLEESVRLHLASDVPLGVFLSGGIDSSILVGLLSRVSSEPVKTFSVVFSEQKFSEAAYSRLVAERYGTDHQEVQLREQDLLQMLPGALDAMDQPTMDGINTYVVSKGVKEAGVTVALSGLGGDELFAGYPSFWRARRLRPLGKIPSPLRRAVAYVGRAAFGDSIRHGKLWSLIEGGGTPWSVYSASRALFGPAGVSSLLGGGEAGDFSTGPSMDAAADPLVESGDPVNAVCRYELRGYMADTLLRDTDFMSMAHSLEVRVPFLDSELVRFVFRLPGEWKLDRGRLKGLLLDASSDLLPGEIRRRPKMGFTLPFERWLRSDLRGEVERFLAWDDRWLRSVGLEPEGTRNIWRSFQKSPSRVGWSRPWALYVLVRWCERNGVTL